MLPRLPSAALPPEFESDLRTPPISIRHSAAVLDEIRLAAVDGLNRMPHGGIEIGGVLFGTHSGNTVHVAAHRPLACEYASGPSFTLSENDRRGLERLLTTAASDAELSGLEAVGWYHAHTRSGIFLSERDLEIFHLYFPQPWQVALVVRPANLDPTRAGFFFREADGSVHAASSYHELVLTPQGRQMEAPPPPAQPTPAASISAAVRETKLELAQPPTVGRPWCWKAAAAATVLLVCGYLALQAYTSRTAAADLSLRAVDFDKQLRVDWNRRADPILHAIGATLDIEDGGTRRRLEIDPAELRAGSVTYARRSGDVLVRLTLRLPAGRAMVEVTRFLAAPGESVR